MAIALTVEERNFYEKTYRDLRLRLIKGECTLGFAKAQLARLQRDLREAERLEKAGKSRQKESS